jgi:hypothetical protein
MRVPRALPAVLFLALAACGGDRGVEGTWRFDLGTALAPFADQIAAAVEKSPAYRDAGRRIEPPKGMTVEVVLDSDGTFRMRSGTADGAVLEGVRGRWEERGDRVVLRPETPTGTGGAAMGTVELKKAGDRLEMDFGGRTVSLTRDS